MTNATFKVGMAVVLVEGGDQLPGLVGQYRQPIASGTSGAIRFAAGILGHAWLVATMLIGVATVW